MLEEVDAVLGCGQENVPGGLELKEMNSFKLIDI